MLKFEIELPRAGLPVDCEVVGLRYGIPKTGDFCLQNCGKWAKVNSDYSILHKLIAVLKPVEIWEPATVEDAIDALSGKKIVCRVWDGKNADYDDRKKIKGHLTGYGPACAFKWSVIVAGHPEAFTHCEVLRP